MTLTDLEDAVLDHFNYDRDNPTGAARLRIRRHLNQWHRRILTKPGVERLRNGILTFASVASTVTYALPGGVARIRRIFETTNDTVLWPRDLEWYRLVDPDPQTGTPDAWVHMGWQAVLRRPASTGLWVASTSASDIVPIAYLQAMRSGGTPSEAQATLNGTTRVAVGALTDYIDVERLYLSAKCIGTVSLYDAAAAGNTLASIRPGATNSKYLVIALWPTPAGAITYTVDYEREVVELANGMDEPLLPEDFQYLLEIGARISEYEKREDARQSKAEAHLDEGLKRLISWCATDPGRVFVPGELEESGPRSRLGSWFPAGT